MNLANNPMYHCRTKHIRCRFHYIRSLVEKVLCLERLGSKNLVDMLTKSVSTNKLRLCRILVDGDDVYVLWGVFTFTDLQVRDCLVMVCGER